jgi:hypothetical protein
MWRGIVLLGAAAAIGQQGELYRKMPECERKIKNCLTGPSRLPFGDIAILGQGRAPPRLDTTPVINSRTRLWF